MKKMLFSIFDRLLKVVRSSALKLTIIAFSIIIQKVYAQNYTEWNKLTASDGASYDQYSFSVSISGNFAIVGNTHDDDFGETTGSAYIYKKDINGNWVQHQKLTASDAAAGDAFGYSVSIFGDYAIVGAYGDDDNGSFSGSAYIFHKNNADTWVQVQKLTPSDGVEGDEFGTHVKINNEYAVVVAYLDDDKGFASGSAYIFKKGETGSWMQHQKLTASDGMPDDGFGSGAAIDKDYLIIGSYRDNDNGQYSGAAYIFEKDEYGYWNEKQKLLANDGSANDGFGIRVSISKNYALIGASGDDDLGSNSGSAYIFQKNESDIWVQQQKIYANDGAEEDNFGFNVYNCGHLVVVGAPQSEANKGAVYTFEEDGTGTWVQKQKLTAGDREEGDYFGISVNSNGEYLLIGAYRSNDKGTESGSAYIFKNNDPIITADLSGSLTICNGKSTSLQVAIANGRAPYTIVLTPDGGNSTITVDNYQSGASIPVSPSTNTVYTLISVVDDNCIPGAVSGEAIINVNPAIDVQTDASCKTVYLGYGSTCTELTATASGGNGTLSYEWNPGSLSGATVEVCPTTTTTYTVTVTDEFGCTQSSDVTVEVVDVRCGNNNNKVQVCHKGQLLCLAGNAVAVHLAHGDNLGACGFIPCDGYPGARIGVEIPSNPALSEIRMRAYPNPTEALLRIQVEAQQAGEAQLDVVDLIGRPLIRQTKQMVEGTNEVTLDLQALPNGIYLIRCHDAYMHQGVLRVSKY